MVQILVFQPNNTKSLEISYIPPGLLLHGSSQPPSESLRERHTPRQNDTNFIGAPPAGVDRAAETDAHAQSNNYVDTVHVLNRSVRGVPHNAYGSRAYVSAIAGRRKPPAQAHSV
jgi:hypothetical protein